MLLLVYRVPFGKLKIRLQFTSLADCSEGVWSRLTAKGIVAVRGLGSGAFVKSWKAPETIMAKIIVTTMKTTTVIAAIIFLVFLVTNQTPHLGLVL